jgi:transposase
MAKSLSVDLRVRVLKAISEGMSRRQAAARFGVSAASAIRWQTLAQRVGAPTPKPQGGDRRSHRIEAHSARILDLVEKTPDITLSEIRARLAEHGVEVSITALWRFFERRQITLKKSRRTPRSKTGQTS